ncbi:PAS domain-containing sensor histidine kinase [Natrinema sp. DC36]|uniref:ATP-binding protein n=1 Tax=Natrinema sp. DC36 TaxID=2878680 RepID=UPI001CF05C3A|nr:PAS domain-containing sensor histidine kinase [Natrinema sp. DC36]
MTLVGLGLLGIVGAYALTVGGPYDLLALELALPTVIGGGHVWYGLRSHDDVEGVDRASIVTICSCLCGIVFAFFCLCSIYLFSLRMGIDVTGGLMQPVLISLSVGLGLGIVLGHVYVEFAQHYRENKRLSRAIDASMDGIAVVVDGRHVYINDAYAALYGLQDESALAERPWHTVYTSESQRRVEREVVPALSDRSYWRGMLTGKRTDGTTFPQDVTVSTLEDGYVVVVRDVTDQRDREQRIQVLNRVLRHNLRNTFTVIRGHANLIADRSPELERRHVRPIREEIDDLLTTADKARSVERALDRHGNADVIEAAEAVRRVADRARASYPDAAIVSRIEIAERGSATTINDVVIDALTELVDNAIEHNTTGRSADGRGATSDRAADGPTVEITVRTVESDDSSRLEFTVTDNGPGIPATERRTILGGRETPLEHGSGLGLWLVNWIVNTTGGELSFADPLKNGTTVRLSFPIARDATTDPSPMQRR